jgi:hypothetical protein
VTDAGLNLAVTGSEFVNLLAGTTLLAANDTVTIDGGTLDLGTLDAFGGNTASVTSMTLGGAQNGSFTVNLGTSGEAGVVMEGAGVQHITASGVLETFTVGTTNHGGSTILNLGVNDLIDVTSGANPALATQVGQASQVNAPGTWNFSGGQLTWWDPSANGGAGGADHLTLTLGAGATGLHLDNGHRFSVI